VIALTVQRFILQKNTHHIINPNLTVLLPQAAKLLMGLLLACRQGFQVTWKFQGAGIRNVPRNGGKSENVARVDTLD
jgi:hypothetical protein